MFFFNFIVLKIIYRYNFSFIDNKNKNRLRQLNTK